MGWASLRGAVYRGRPDMGTPSDLISLPVIARRLICDDQGPMAVTR